MTTPINSDTFRTAFYEVDRNNGINNLVTRLRNDLKYRKNLGRQDMINLFSNLPLWKRVDNGDGHVCFQNVLTKVRIGFQAHGKTSNIAAAQAVSIMDQLQEHMNILGNEIFAYRTRSWKTEPDYDAAVMNFNNWTHRFQAA